MNSIIEQLSEIESAAEAIVDHAEQQKGEIEKKIQAQRDQFDRDLEEETQEKLAAIRAETEAKMNQVLGEQKEKNQFMLDHLQKEYEEKHEIYAEEILRHIIEV